MLVWRRRWCGSSCRRWGRSWAAGCQLETANAGAPVKRGRRGIVFVGVPERGVVHGIDRQRAVIAPAIAAAALAARAVKKMGFALAQSVQWIGRQSPRVTELRLNARAGGAKTDGEISLPVHRRASHPAPGRVRLISALLVDGDGSGSHVTQLKPAHACHPAGAYGVGADDRFVIAKIPVSQAKHQTVPDAVEIV